jgi:hypothetical protein
VETLLWLLDEALDVIPCCEDGRWRWYWGWGCRLAYRFPVLRGWEKYERR